MTVKYAQWSGGLSSGAGLTPATAWDVAYALGASSRLGAGDELRIMDTTQYTMTKAAQLFIRCGSGTAQNPVRIVAADSFGNPYRGRRRSLFVLAGDNQVTWGTSTSTSSMIRVDTSDNDGTTKIRYLWFEDLAFDGQNRPYNILTNGGPSNNLNDNYGYTCVNCAFNESYHNNVSLFCASDSAGNVGLERAHSFYGCDFITDGAANASNAVLIVRPPTIRALGGYYAENCTFRLTPTTSGNCVGLQAGTVKSTFVGCTFANGTLGIQGATGGGALDAIRCTFSNHPTAGIQINGTQGGNITGCAFTGCSRGIQDEDTDPIVGSTAPYRHCKFHNCTTPVYSTPAAGAFDITTGDNLATAPSFNDAKRLCNIVTPVTETRGRGRWLR